MSQKKLDSCNYLAAAICNALAGSLTRVCNVAWHFTGLEDSLPQLEQGDGYRILFGNPLDGHCLLSFASSEPSWTNGQAGEGDAASALSSAILEMEKDIKGLLSPDYKHLPVSIDKASGGVSDPDALRLCGRLHSAESQLRVHLLLDAELIANLQKPGMDLVFIVAAASAGQSANLDLVLGVELNVTLRFGRRQLPLREIIDLTSGSVVELDRQVDEPVELVLDGRVVARGEAVVIDGNYGMRVTQIVNPVFQP